MQDHVQETSVADPVPGRAAPDRLFAEVCDQLEDGSVQRGMHALFSGLHRLRIQLVQDDWKAVIDQARRHRLFELVMQDPITKRCFEKPRGYAGDAGLLDLIYGWPAMDDVVASASTLGRAIYGFTRQTTTARSVRERREELSGLIDRCAADTPNPRILSLAAGHLREGVDSVGLRNGEIAELVALDQDADSIAEVKRVFAGSAVRTEVSSIRAILTGRTGLGKFDLIYSAGLYDYLEMDVATRLTTRMFSMLRPGGRLWVANFLPEIGAVGYMEAYMDWHLQYRTPTEIREFAREILSSDMSSCSVTVDRHNHIGSLELVRRAVHEHGVN